MLISKPKLIPSIIAVCLFTLGIFSFHHAHGRTLSKEQAQFVDKLLPSIRQQNQQLLKERQKLQKIYNIVLNGAKLNNQQQTHLNAICEKFNIKNFNKDLPESWNELFRRVDIIPASLVLAQAINESAWGKSRFAKEANNYFGRWCYTTSCGLIPKKRPKGATYEVKRFASAEAAVDSYFNNINTGRFYHQLRVMRAQARQQHQYPNSLVLAKGLERYSQKRAAYVKIIQTIISQFNLQRFDANNTKNLS